MTRESPSRRRSISGSRPWAAAARPTAEVDAFDLTLLDRLECEWDAAIGAAEDAVVAATGMLVLSGRMHALTAERARTATLLDAVAHVHGIAAWSSALALRRATSARAGR